MNETVPGKVSWITKYDLDVIELKVFICYCKTETQDMLKVNRSHSRWLFFVDCCQITWDLVFVVIHDRNKVWL